VRPDLSSLDRLRMAISENQMREDFTQADRVGALDALQALVEDTGLRAAARALGISAGWSAAPQWCSPSVQAVSTRASKLFLARR
jgi:hypothetical protein